MIFVFLLYGLFASVFVISKVGLAASAPFFLIGSRMIAAGVILIGWYAYKEGSLKLTRETWKLIALLGFLNIYVTNAFEFWGLQYLTSFKTCFIYSLSPFASALLSFILLSEKMTAKKWLGLLVGFAGFIPLFLHHTQTEEQAGVLWAFSWAELSVVGAALTSVWGWIVLKQLVCDKGVSPLAANGFSMLIGGALALSHSLFTEEWNPVPVYDTLQFSFAAVLLIIVSNLICYNLYGWLLKRFSATFMSFAGFTTPLFTALFGWFFLGETIAAPFYISSAIVFSGLLLFYHEELVLKPQKSV
jgi:drug/metabolite transporter (DMT)-like permease